MNHVSTEVAPRWGWSFKTIYAILLHPAHPDFKKIEVGQRVLALDARLGR